LNRVLEAVEAVEVLTATLFYRLKERGTLSKMPAATVRAVPAGLGFKVSP
jgi:hypothetical protein